MSNKKIVLGAGHGTTGTRSLDTALQLLGMRGLHWTPNRPFERFLLDTNGHEACKGWTQDSPEMVVNPKVCREQLRNFDFTSMIEKVKYALDIPIPEHFLDFFLAYPNAKFILTKRPSMEWAQSRAENHPFLLPPLQEPCGRCRKQFSLKSVAHMEDAHVKFVQCMVPKERLLEFNLWEDPDDRLKGLMQELGDFVQKPVKNQTFPSSKLKTVRDYSESTLDYSDDEVEPLEKGAASFELHDFFYIAAQEARRENSIVLRV